MFQERIEKVRANMKADNMDAMLVTSTDAIYYLLGIEIHAGERMIVLSVLKDEIKLYINALFPLADMKIPVCYFNDVDDPVSLLSESLKSSKRIGVDKDWPSRFLLKLMKVKPDADYIDGSFTVDMARLIKAEDEKVLMRKASEVNDAVMGMMFNALSERVLTEIEAQEVIKESNASLGVNRLSFTPLICFGKGGAEPHHDSDETKLMPDQGIIVDIGGRREGYCSDMTRSFFYGTPSEEYIKVYNLVLVANLAAIKQVKPGVSFKSIDEAARAVIRDGGYGDYFTHRTGHGIGINVHEFPDVSAANEMICQAGMVFSIEPGIYLDGKFGVRIEDLVLVTEDGCEVLNAYPKELKVIPVHD